MRVVVIRRFGLARASAPEANELWREEADDADARQREVDDSGYLERCHGNLRAE